LAQLDAFSDVSTTVAPMDYSFAAIE
jgi:hypothetical protein